MSLEPLHWPILMGYKTAMKSQEYSVKNLYEKLLTAINLLGEENRFKDGAFKLGVSHYQTQDNDKF